MSGSLFNYSPLSDGPIHTAADHNTPFAAVAAIINGGIGTVNVVPGGLDATVFTPEANPQKLLAATTVPFVVSGLTISTSGTLASTTASGVAYVNGKKVSPASTPHTYTASKDTYVDLKDDGTYAYVEVANGATSGMTLTTNSDGSNALRIAAVVTSGSAVTAVTQSLFDNLGNRVYNTSPQRKLIGYGERAASSPNTTSHSYVDTGIFCTALINAGDEVRVTVWASRLQNSIDGQNTFLAVYDDGTGSALTGTELAQSIGSTAAANGLIASVTVSRVYSPSAGSHTYRVALAVDGGTGTLAVDTASRAYVSVEIV